MQLKGIAMQVNSAISGFVSNFMTALNPQITKSYASGNQDYMMALIFQGAKFLILYVVVALIAGDLQYSLYSWAMAEIGAGTCSSVCAANVAFCHE